MTATPVTPVAASGDDEDDDERADLETATRHEIVIPPHAHDQRLDAFLAAALPLSRSRLQQLIEAGRVVVDGAPARHKKDPVGAGARVVVLEPPPAPVELVPEDLPLRVLFEDEHLVVIDKQAGMAVHPGAGIASGTVANAVLFRAQAQAGGSPRAATLSIGGDIRPGIVHRLDKDTSGVLVVAKDDATHQALSRAFAAREIDKRYTAFCLGVPGRRAVGERFELVTGHRRADGDRRRFTTRLPPPDADDDRVRSGVRRAHTAFLVELIAGGAARLDVQLFTGRTHQIRAHLADIGHPLLQDELYGGGRADKRLPDGDVRDAVVKLRRHALHARRLAFVHPHTKARLELEAPLPDDLRAVDDAMRGSSPPVPPTRRRA